MGLIVIGINDKEMFYIWKILLFSWLFGQFGLFFVIVVIKLELIYLIQRVIIRFLGSFKVRNNFMFQFRYWQLEIGDVIGKIRNI